VVSPFRSSVIDAPLERLWALVGDFGGMARWMPFVARCEIEHGAAPTEVGAVRHIEQSNDVYVRERLVALSETDHSYRYSLVEGNIPIHRYEATMRLFPVTDGGRTYWHGSGDSRSTRRMPPRS
jgi:NADPH2:quinone reductase